MDADPGARGMILLATGVVLFVSLVILTALSDRLGWSKRRHHACVAGLLAAGGCTLLLLAGSGVLSALAVSVGVATLWFLASEGLDAVIVRIAASCGDDASEQDAR